MNKTAYQDVPPKTQNDEKPESTYLVQKITLLGMFILTVIINVISSVGMIGESQGDISDQYDTLITPPGYAFSIWGLIYFFWAAFIVLQFAPNRFLSQPRVFYDNSWKGKGFSKNCLYIVFILIMRIMDLAEFGAFVQLSVVYYICTEY